MLKLLQVEVLKIPTRNNDVGATFGIDSNPKPNESMAVLRTQQPSPFIKNKNKNASDLNFKQHFF